MNRFSSVTRIATATSSPRAGLTATMATALAAALLAAPQAASARSITRAVPAPARARRERAEQRPAERADLATVGPEIHLLGQAVSAALLPRLAESAPLATAALVPVVGDIAHTAALLARPAAVARVLPILTTAPVPGAITSPFGYRRDPFNRHRHHFHPGVDLHARRGEKVHAAGAGVVVGAHWVHGYGRMIVIDHGFGIRTRYAHLHRYRVHRGERVSAGQVIGTAGSTGRATGPHVHFEVRAGGRPIDPEKVLAEQPASPWSPRQAAGIADSAR